MENLTSYLTAMAQGHVMLDRHLITTHEFLAYEEKMRQKYHISENSIYRDYRLIMPPARANMPH